MKLKALSLEKVNIRELLIFLTLSGIVSLFPFFIHFQWLTGPFVNAVLIIILFLTNLQYSILACAIPSFAALAGGLLPIIMLPIIPYIILGNMIFIVTIHFFYEKKLDNRGFWGGLFIGSFLKFILLFSISKLVLELYLQKNLVLAASQLMSWPQFATAISGGLIAWIFLKWLKRI